MDWPWRISPSQNPEQGEGETGAATSPGVPSQAEHPHHAGAGSAVGWAGGGRRKCGGNVSSVLGNAAAGRGTEGPRGRAPTLSPCTAPSPTGTRRGPEGGPRGWHKAVFLPVLGARGPSAQHGWRGASGSGQAPPAASIQQLHPSLERKRGAASPPAPPPPAGQRASPPLPWPGPPLGWAGEGSLLPSLGIPGSRHGATGAGGRTSRQREAEGRCQPTLCQHQFPAITAAAPAAV